MLSLEKSFINNSISINGAPTMSEECFLVFYLLIVLGTPFCGSQECHFVNNDKSYICNDIIDTFPEIFYGNYHLKCLDCNARTISTNTFPYDNTLISFNMSNSGIQHIQPDSFLKLKSLEYLYLNDNELKNISADAFSGLRYLYELHLENNFLVTLEKGFLNGVQSNFINISNNMLLDLPAMTFDGVKGLLQLDLSHNKINTIHKNVFYELIVLEYLDMAFNNICHLPLGVFRSLISLRNLNLSNNKFTRLNAGAFSGLKNLNFLALANNALKVFDANILIPMMHLTKLDISGNAMSFLDAYEIWLNAPTIRVVSLEDNIFSCIHLKNVLQYCKGKLVDVESNVLRFDYQNINGIACIEDYTNVEGISLEYFLKKAKEEANLLASYC